MQFKEKIVFAPGANETELLRSLVKQGEQTLGTRVLNAKELALFAIERNGISFKKKLLSDTEAAFIVYKILKENKYFSNIKLSDAIQYIKSINEFRMHLNNEKELEKLEDGNFKSKNLAILESFSKYNEILGNELADEISLINYVIENKLTIDIEVNTLKEFKLKPLEKKLVEVLTNNSYKEISCSEKNINIKKYIKTFGEKAEAEYVIKYILDNNIKFDEVTVAVTDDRYGQVFEDLALQNKIPVNIGIRKTVMNTNPGRLLSQLYDLHNNFYFKDNLIGVLLSDYINKDKLADDLGVTINEHKKASLASVGEVAGNLRFNFNYEENNQKLEKYQEFLNNKDYSKKEYYSKEEQLNVFNGCKKLNEILKEGFKGLFSYAKIIREKEDKYALENIISFMTLGASYGIPFEQLFEQCQSLAIPGTLSTEGNVYVTKINNAKSIIRKYLFVLGLSSQLYPGSPKEDYLFLDTDYNLIGYDGKKSHNDLSDKIFNLRTLLELNHKNEIFLLYPYYETNELKNKNASSFIFDLYNELTNNNDLDNFEKNIVESQGFSSSILSVNRNILENYTNDVLILNTDNDSKEIDADQSQEISNEICFEKDLDRYHSATEIDTYFRCPKKYYYKHILGCEDPFDTNPIDDVNPMEYGNILHAALEELDKSIHTDVQDFLNIIEDVFNNEFRKTHAFASEELALKKLKELKEVGKNAYALASKNKSLLCETDIYATHSSGVKIHGLPDRVEVDSDGKLIIIDYKTKNKEDHSETDFNTCAQILTYAYLINEQFKGKYEVKECRYRYVKLLKDITINEDSLKTMLCEYNETMNKMNKSLTNGYFEKTEKEDNCKYCPYRLHCGYKEN